MIYKYKSTYLTFKFVIFQGAICEKNSSLNFCSQLPPTSLSLVQLIVNVLAFI